MTLETRAFTILVSPLAALCAGDLTKTGSVLRVFKELLTVQQEPLVLLVEDDPQARDGYAEFLERGGFRVAQAGTAEDALSISIAVVPDVVVTDIALPGRDGFSLAAALQAEVRTRGVPVVAMTAYWATDVHERADRAGITAILLKPCQPEHLIAELQRVLQRTKLPRVIDQMSSTGAPSRGRSRSAEAKSYF